MPLVLQEGDLFASGLPALAHGCNCQGVMGAGIAVQFRERWPRMYAEYRRRCSVGEFRLGDVMMWRDIGWAMPFSPVTIFNLATQDRPGPDARLDALTVSVARMLLLAGRNGITAVGMPMIGCGIGGLEWEHVNYTLEVLAARSPVELIVHSYDPAKTRESGLLSGRRAVTVFRVFAVAFWRRSRDPSPAGRAAIVRGKTAMDRSVNNGAAPVTCSYSSGGGPCAVWNQGWPKPYTTFWDVTGWGIPA